MRTPVLCIAPETTLDEATELMDEHGVSCLPVVDGSELIGLVTREGLAVLDRRACPTWRSSAPPAADRKRSGAILGPEWPRCAGDCLEMQAAEHFVFVDQLTWTSLTSTSSGRPADVDQLRSTS